MIIDLYKFDFWELFEIGCQRLGDAVDHAGRLAIADEINPGDAFGEFQLAVAGEAIGDECQAV